MINTARILLLTVLVASTADARAEVVDTELQRQVRETEQAFAQTMADRDFDAFVSFLSVEAIFFAGELALNGSDAVAEAWKPYFEQAQAPFSWRPLAVEVLDSGELALSTGPVLDPGGKCVGTFTSIWRLEAEGDWKIIFDKGSRDCPQ
jgi:ketosteroid isomerase-like protein